MVKDTNIPPAHAEPSQEAMDAAPQTPVKKAPRIRDAEATRQRILAAAKREFATVGLGGGRVDVIAVKAKANKRMIYHYFGNKENLFQTVVENAYIDIRTAEQKLQLDDMTPSRALEELVRFTWAYYLKNPEFITLVNSENLHHAKHLKRSLRVQEASRKMVAMISGILERGVASGAFRSGVDPVQLNISIAAVGYFYLTNRHTGSIMYERDMMTPAALDERLAFNIEMILRMAAAD